MKRTKAFFITALLISFATQLYAQDKLNLNFEKINPVTHTFEHWNMNMSATGSEGYIAGIDSVIKERGKYSLFIEKDTANKNGGMVGSCINHILVNFKGKEIELTGYVRTRDVTKFASIIIRLKDNNGEVTNNLAQLGKGIRGTTGWTKYSYKMPMDSTTREITIVPNLMGNGKAWFDNFKLYVDGIPYNRVRKYHLTSSLSE